MVETGSIAAGRQTVGLLAPPEQPTCAHGIVRVTLYKRGRPSDASNEKAIGMRHLPTSKFDESTPYMRKPCHTGRTARGVPLSFSTMQGT